MLSCAPIHLQLLANKSKACVNLKSKKSKACAIFVVRLHRVGFLLLILSLSLFMHFFCWYLLGRREKVFQYMMTQITNRLSFTLILQTLFRSNLLNDKHPVVFMKDVDFDNLKSLVEYMYKGEANVPQNMLASFIKTAESLQVRGLAECATKQLENEGLNSSSSPADLPPAATSTPTSSLASKVIL